MLASSQRLAERHKNDERDKGLLLLELELRELELRLELRLLRWRAERRSGRGRHRCGSLAAKR